MVKVAQFLTGLGIDAKELGDSAKQILAKQVQNVVDKQQNKQKEENIEFNNNVERIVDSASMLAPKTNYLYYIIGGGLIVFLMTKK